MNQLPLCMMCQNSADTQNCQLSSFPEKEKLSESAIVRGEKQLHVLQSLYGMFHSCGEISTASKDI